MEQNTHRQKPETDIPEVDRQVLVLNGTAQVLDTLKVKLLRVFLTNKNIKSIIYTCIIGALIARYEYLYLYLQY